jgi:CubicO group peptidase (beta-lactamase class C family)
MNLSTYLTPRLWQAVGAEHSAFWLSEKTGLEVAMGNFNATLRDYGRLGVVLANDGMRPDTRKQVVAREYLREATDWTLAEPAFQPGSATSTLGYGYQFWTFPGPGRRFAMLGAFGQSIFVDPSQRLVIVQTAANATEDAGDTSLSRERTAFWRGVMSYYEVR